MSLQTADRQRADAVPERCSFEQFIAQADEDVWAEWVDGRVIRLPAATDRHQDLMGFLLVLLSLFVETHDAGWIRCTPFLMHLPTRAQGLLPDLLFVRKERMDRVQSTYLEGPADLVVEIVSAESIGRDRGDKFVEYEAGGVPEYWLIDPLRERAEIYHLDGQGRYQPMPLEEGVLTSRTVPGFRLCVDWLWRKPLPKILEAAAELSLLA